MDIIHNCSFKNKYMHLYKHANTVRQTLTARRAYADRLWIWHASIKVGHSIPGWQAKYAPGSTANEHMTGVGCAKGAGNAQQFKLSRLCSPTSEYGSEQSTATHKEEMNSARSWKTCEGYRPCRRSRWKLLIQESLFLCSYKLTDLWNRTKNKLPEMAVLRGHLLAFRWLMSNALMLTLKLGISC